MHELYITKFNTINGDNFEEISINEFINMLSSNNYDIVGDDYLDFEIKYETEVYKDQAGYVIIYNDNKYHINTDKYPYLTEKFEKFAVITKNRIIEKRNYDSLKSEKVNNHHEYVDGLSYLEKANYCAKRKHNFILTKFIASIIGFPTPIILFFLVLTTCDISSICLICLLLVSILVSTVSLASLENCHKYIENIKKYGKICKLTNKKIKQLKRKLSRNNSTNIEIHATSIDTNDMYKDNMLNYMNNIMNATSRLNKEERKQKLLELKAILSEYTNKCQKLNENDDKIELTLEGGKRQIMMDTIKKLTELEMEIADMLNRDIKNKAITTESSKLMKELDSNLKNIDTDEPTVSVAKGR